MRESGHRRVGRLHAARLSAVVLLAFALSPAPAPALSATGRFVCCAGGPGCPLTADPQSCGGQSVTNVGFQTRNSISLTFDAAGGPVTGTAELHEFMLLLPSVYSIYTATLTGTFDRANRTLRGNARTHEYTVGYPGSPCERGCESDHDDTWSATVENGKIVGIISYGFSVFEIAADIDVKTPTPSSTATPSSTPTPTPQVDYVADALEVVQSVQDITNDVRFVANKRTFVRLHGWADVRPAGVQPATNAPDTATLEVERDGDSEVLLPINPGGGIRLKDSNFVRRMEMDDAFLFELPGRFLDGSLTLTGRIAPGPWETRLSNNVFVEHVSFETVPPLELKLYAVQNVDSPVPQPDFVPLLDWLDAAFPVHWVRDERRALLIASGIDDTPEELALLLNARRLWNRVANNEPETVRYYAVYLDPNPSPDIFGDIVIGFGFGGAGAGLNDSPELGAHELGHTLGGHHPHNVCGAWDPLSPFPYLNGSISRFAFANDPFAMVGFDKRTQTLYAPYGRFFPDDGYWDIMTYCARRWLSDFHYHTFMDTLRSEAAGRATRLGETRDHLLVVGLATADAQQVRVAPMFTLPDVPTLAPSPSGDYAVVLRDAQGTELSRHLFTPDTLHVDPPPGTASQADPATLSIAEWVPFVAGTDRVDVEGPAGPLYSVTAGSAIPSVTVDSPNGGEMLAGDPLSVTWSADDADGDPLVFNVQYSADGGATWSLVAQSERGDRATIDRIDLIGSDRARVRVFVSDGVHTSSDESDAPFAIANRAPTAAIIAPATELTVAAGQTVGLEGRAYDTDQGALPAEAVTWESDRDGVLGHGPVAPVASLSVGTHQVTLRAVDDAGSVATDTVRVTVVSDLAALPPIADALVVTPKLVQLDTVFGLRRDSIFIDNANLTTPIAWRAVSNTTWLQLSASSGTTPAAVWVSADTHALAEGTYSASVTITSPDLPGSEETVAVVVVVGTPVATGDCNGDGAVRIDELVRGVNIALDALAVSACPPCDANGDARVTVDELVLAVNNALYGVRTPTPIGPTGTPGAPTVTPTRPAPTHTPTAAGPITVCDGLSAPLSIPDDDGVGISDVVMVAAVAPIADLDVEVEIDHTWVGDLVVRLTHVDTGRQIALIDRPGYTLAGNGCDSDDVRCVLDDAAATPCESACATTPPALGGRLSPNDALSAFVNESAHGQWRLTVRDLSARDVGTLRRWCLHLTSG